MAEAAQKGGGFGDLLAGLFNPRSGRLDPVALFSGDVRDENRRYRDAQNTLMETEARDKQFAQVKGVMDMFGASPTDTQQAGTRQVLESQGFDSALLAPLARGATETRKKGRQAYRAAGGSYEGSLVADADSARDAGQTAFAQQEQRTTNLESAQNTRQTQREQAGLTRTTDQMRQDRAFGYQTEGARYNAILDTWKNEQQKGTKADPYPVLRRLYDEKAFAGNTGLEDLVVSHLVNKTDPEAAGKLLSGFQDTVVKPTRANQTIEGRKAEAAQAEAWLAANGDQFAQGSIQRKRLASAKGQAAVKLQNRLIEQTDFTGKDASVFGQALAEWRQNAPASAAPELLAKVDAALGVGGKAAEDVFGQIPVTSPKPEDVEDQSASDFVQAVLSTPGLDEKTVPPAMRDTLIMAATAGGQTAKDAAKTLFERITKVGSGNGNMAKLTGNVYGRKLLESQTAHEMALADLESMERFRGKKALFGVGAGPFAAAGRLSEKVLGLTPSEYTQDRTALEAASGSFMANFIKGLSGAVVTEAEFERLSRVGPNERDSESAFFIKRDLMAAAKQRDLERTRAQQEAFLNDDLEAFNAIAAERGRAIGELNAKMQKVPGSGSGDGPPLTPDELQLLTPEERQGLGQ